MLFGWLHHTGFISDALLLVCRYFCEICDAKFRRVHHLQKHLRSGTHRKQVAQLRQDGHQVLFEFSMMHNLTLSFLLDRWIQTLCPPYCFLMALKYCFLLRKLQVGWLVIFLQPKELSYLRFHVRKVMFRREDMSRRSWVQIPVPEKDFSVKMSVKVYFYSHLAVEFIH